MYDWCFQQAAVDVAFDLGRNRKFYSIKICIIYLFLPLDIFHNTLCIVMMNGIILCNQIKLYKVYNVTLPKWTSEALSQVNSVSLFTWKFNVIRFQYFYSNFTNFLFSESDIFWTCKCQFDNKNIGYTLEIFDGIFLSY